jgi:hypothetical protein
MCATLADNVLITGTLTEPDDDNPSLFKRYVYQRVAPGLGHRTLTKARDLQRRRHVIPYDTRTPYQLALRARFADATAAWHTLTDEEKAAYAERAAVNRWSNFNQHVREWTRAHALDPADYPDTGLGELSTHRLRATLRILHDQGLYQGTLSAHDLTATLHRAGALPGFARVTNPRALQAIATHPHQPPGVIPPLHVNLKSLLYP